jgi:hypothetical protein
MRGAIEPEDIEGDLGRPPRRMADPLLILGRLKHEN